MNIKHNLLYKTWTAGLRRWRRRWLLKKRKNAKKTYKNVHLCILPMQARTVTCYKTDPSSCQGGCPMTKPLSWLQLKSGYESQRGSSVKTGLTDQPTISCKVTLTLNSENDIFSCLSHCFCKYSTQMTSSSFYIPFIRDWYFFGSIVHLSSSM